MFLVLSCKRNVKLMSCYNSTMWSIVSYGRITTIGTFFNSFLLARGRKRSYIQTDIGDRRILRRLGRILLLNFDDLSYFLFRRGKHYHVTLKILNPYISKEADKENLFNKQELL